MQRIMATKTKFTTEYIRLSNQMHTVKLYKHRRKRKTDVYNKKATN